MNIKQSLWVLFAISFISLIGGNGVCAQEIKEAISKQQDNGIGVVAEEDLSSLLGELDQEVNSIPEVTFMEKTLLAVNFLVLKAENLGIEAGDLIKRLVSHIKENKIAYSTAIVSLIFVGVVIYYFTTSEKVNCPQRR